VGSPGFGDNTGEFVDLLLRAAKGTESLLRQLAGTLIFAVADQFDDPFLVRCQPGNFLDDIPNEERTLRRLPSGPRDFRLRFTPGDFVAFVDADGKTGLLFLLRHCEFVLIVR